MATEDNEEGRLRSVALQNAQSILLARRRAEEALRKQSEWLRVTLSSIGDAVISTDAEGRVTFMNGAAESLTGWPQAEALGRPLPEVFHIISEESRRPVTHLVEKVFREGKQIGLANHTVLIAKDGTEWPIDDSAAPIRDDKGQVVGIVLVFHDITQRRHAEEALRRTQQELSDFVENSTIGMHWIGPDGIILWANRTELELLGYAREQFIGRHIAEFHADPPVIEDILQRLARGETLNE
jgi:PAS domain S-box-containing protein